MNTSLARYALGALVVYVVLCAGIAWWSARRTHSESDFFVGGQRLGAFVSALAMFASTLSGFGFVGGPGLVYAHGVTSFWIIAATPLGFALGLLLLARPLRAAAERERVISLLDVVHARFQSRPLRAISALAILLGCIAYVGTQVLALAVAVKLVLATAGVGVSMPTLIVVTTVFLVAYCTFGGVLASIYTDVLQGCIMVVAAVWVFIAAWQTFDGGLPRAIDILAFDSEGAVGAFGVMGPLAALSWFVIFALGNVGQPQVVSKILMLRSSQSLKSVLPMTTLAYTLSALLWIGIGLAVRAAVLEGRIPALRAADDAAATFLTAFAPPTLAALVFVGLLSAIMSTADAFLNLGALTLTHDLPMALTPGLRARFKRSGKRRLWPARGTTVLLGAAGAYVALVASRSSGPLIGLLGALGWSMLAATLVPLLAIGLQLKRVSSLAAVLSVAFGLVANILPELLPQLRPGAIHTGALSITVTCLVFLSLNAVLATSPSDRPARDTAELDLP